MQWSSASMITCVGVIAFLPQPLLDVVHILVDDRLAQKLGVANVSHVGVFIRAQRVEATDSLTSAIVFHERYWSIHIDLALFLRHFLLFNRDWCRAVATAVLDDVVDRPEESRVAM